MPKPGEAQEPRFDGRQWQYPFEWHATAMGYFIKEFANLEFHVGVFFQLISGYPREEVRIILDAAGNGVPGRLKLALHFSVLRAPNDGWLSHARNLFGKIEKLAERRNQIVHHWWLSSDTGYSQVNDKVRVQKPDGRPMLSDPTETEADTQTIWNLANEVREASWSLMDLASRCQNPHIGSS